VPEVSVKHKALTLRPVIWCKTRLGGRSQLSKNLELNFELITNDPLECLNKYAEYVA
jgi:hypothetical protein